MGIPERSIGSVAPLVVVDRPPLFVALGFDMDALYELLDDRGLLFGSRPVEAVVQAFKELDEVESLSVALFESLLPHAQPHEVVVDLVKFVAVRGDTLVDVVDGDSRGQAANGSGVEVEPAFDFTRERGLAFV